MKFTFTTMIILFLCSCQINNDKQTDSSNTFELPELLDRSEKIRYGKEWESVQNNYAKAALTIRSDKQDAKSLLHLSEIFINEARITGEHGHYYPAALSCLNQLLSFPKISANDKFITLKTKAGVQLSLHEFHNALETAEKAIALNKSNAGIYGVLVDCYVELGRYEEAIVAADKMISIKPDLRSYSRVSYLREIHGDVEGAIDALILAVQSSMPGEERRAWSMLQLGQLYHKYDKSELAKSVFEQCVKERENYSFAIDAIGQIHLQENKITEAYAQFKQAASIIPEVGYYQNMATVYKSTNQIEAFETIMKEVMIMLREDTDSGHNMNLEYADIYLNLLSDTDKALEYAAYEYDKRPDNIDVNKILTEIYLEKGDVETARYHLSLASSTGSKDPSLNNIRKLISKSTTS
jgi:pentatricopeptide repeat protein